MGLLHAEVIQGVTPEELQNALQGRTILDAHRKGKHLWLELDGDSPAVLFHLGMTGYMVVEGVPIVQYVNAKKRGEEWPPKYWKVLSRWSDSSPGMRKSINAHASLAINPWCISH